MVEYVILNVGPRITTSIHKNTFANVINSLPKFINDIQVNKTGTNVKILQNNKNIIVSLEIKIKEGVDIKTKILEIKDKIETHFEFLMDQKPINTIINYIGSF